MGEHRTRDGLRRLEIVGAVMLAVCGVVLHYAYGWSGRNDAVASVVPANESVWEHLKLVAIPVLLLGLAETRLLPDRRRLWWAKVVEVAVGCGFIVAFFYTYTGALGVHSVVAVDIVSFFAAVALGQWTSYRMIRGRAWAAPWWVSAIAVALIVGGFAALTFAPPHVPLFEQISDGLYGPG